LRGIIVELSLSVTETDLHWLHQDFKNLSGQFAGRQLCVIAFGREAITVTIVLILVTAAFPYRLPEQRLKQLTGSNKD